MNNIDKSHLTRGAWIETLYFVRGVYFDESHLTRGAWIETNKGKLNKAITLRRTSHEVRGLKPSPPKVVGRSRSVAPHTRCVD